jgi:hypothetical protein
MRNPLEFGSVEKPKRPPIESIEKLSASVTVAQVIDAAKAAQILNV